MNDRKEIKKSFSKESEAEAYWNKVKPEAGFRIVKNELEYCKDGSFEVVTVMVKVG